MNTINVEITKKFSSQAASNNPAGGVTMWIILGVLIVIILGLFVFTAIKDKVKKKKKKKQDAIFKQKTAEQMQIMNIRLKVLMEITEEYLAKFKPSIGDFKMKDIVKVANTYLSNIENDTDFKEFIINSEDSRDFLRAFVKLTHVRCNNWSKQCADVKAFFDKNVADLDPDLVKEVGDKAQVEITQYYEKGLFGNESTK
ncbi:MHJ_0274 family protein [Mycoplasmopsis adleri]|uniref:MHJ_0274 family protein n=1 Tax=Mycoplasmopsis adleri TaxID=51362 RepID=UPI0038739EB2